MISTTLRYSKAGHHPDYFLIALIFVLTTMGLVILTSASSEIGKLRFDDSYYYLKNQLQRGLFLGLLGFFAGMKIHYQIWRKLAPFMLIGTIALLLLVFTPLGITMNNAARWIQIGPFSFQPAELLKIAYVIYVAAWLSNARREKARGLAEGFLPFLIISGSVAVILFLQPATSVVLILLSAGCTMYFMSNLFTWRHILIAIPIVALTIGLLLWATPYRLQRIKTYLDPTQDLYGAGYQRNQALIAIGSGGLYGLGFGESPSKVRYLPAPLDDSIFAIAAQELGFIGSGILAALFAIFVFRLFWLAHHLRDRFGQLILIGFATVIGLQAFVNMAAISGLIPLTGVPLPFVSYGGTALAIFLAMGGIATNISKYS